MDIREKIHKESLAAWVNSGKKGTLELITGLGKTKIGLEAVQLYPTSAKILFLAESTDRELDLRREQDKWFVHDHNIQFACYQSAYKWTNTEWDLVIADEIHDSLTKEYSKFYRNNTCKAIMGLSATVDRRAVVDSEELIFKGQLLDEIAPVCYKYTMDQGQKEGTARKLELYIINHKLDAYSKGIIGGTKAKPFLQSEFDAYNYRDLQFKRSLFSPPEIRDFSIRNSSAARAKLLYELPSKIEACKLLISSLQGRTLLFGNSLPALLSITPNVVSSKNSEAKNLKIREAFEKGEHNLIASFKKLKQGANLEGGIDNIVIHSYYSKSKDLIQRIGRMRQDGTVGKVFIFVTFGTQEVKWFDMMFEGIVMNKISCHTVEDCLSKLT